MNRMTNKAVALAQLLAVCSLAILQVASLPVFEEDKLPAIDLRKTGCVHQIEDEGSCGASYAYVAMAFSAYYDCMSKKPAADAKGSVERYHARFISDCGSSFSVNIGGCRGGFVSNAVDFVTAHGLPLFADYEPARTQAGDNDKCPVMIPGQEPSIQNWQVELQPMEYLQGTKLVKINANEIYNHLSKHGPVVANLQLFPEYKSYKGEIYESFFGNQVFQTHSMLIVGFDYNDQNRPYYTLWNTEGTGWGDKGYLKMFEFSLEIHHLSFYGIKTW